MADGFREAASAGRVTRALERCGASGVVLQDQATPRRCGHRDGKRLLPFPDDLAKLQAVVQACSVLLLAASTGASNPSVIQHRLQAFEQAGCDAVLVDALAAGSQDLAHCRALLEANVITATRA